MAHHPKAAVSRLCLSVLLFLSLASTCSHHQIPLQDEPVPSPEEQMRLEDKWGSDWAFSGISTFAHLPHIRCLTQRSARYDFAIVGAPFDTAVSYRPGARFGPRAIRAASARQMPGLGYNRGAKTNPYMSWAKIIDCGDIPAFAFDNAIAEKEMEEAFFELGRRRAYAAGPKASDGDSDVDSTEMHPVLVTLGGDHSIALPALRALYRIHGNRPLSLLHFDSHQDTWNPTKYPGVKAIIRETGDAGQSAFNHGSMFWTATLSGLLSNTSSVHAGLRTRLSGTSEANDYDDNEAEVNFLRIHADEMDDDDDDDDDNINGHDEDDEGDEGTDDNDEGEEDGEKLEKKNKDRARPRREAKPSGYRSLRSRGRGPAGIADRIRAYIPPDALVYLSIDIDVLDPAYAPGTGTPEPAGWTTRELIRVLRGALRGKTVVGVDLVEVSPPYDGRGEETALAAAQVVFETLSILVKEGERKRGKDKAGRAKGGKDGRIEL